MSEVPLYGKAPRSGRARFWGGGVHQAGERVRGSDDLCSAMFAREINYTRNRSYLSSLCWRFGLSGKGSPGFTHEYRHAPPL